MFALCVEATKEAGYGHFFRSMIIASELIRMGEKVMLFVNPESRLKSNLEESGVSFFLVDNIDAIGWRGEVIRKNNIKVWIEDRLHFSESSIRETREAGVVSVGLDLVPVGPESPDMVFSMMPCFYGRCKAKHHVFEGPEYFILDPALKEYRRVREKVNKILIMFGGTDTYSITGKVVDQLKDSFALKVIVGAGADIQNSWEGDQNIQLVRAPRSLYAEFMDCDLAVCAGGITPFEMVSTGLPVCMIATEPHEKRNAEYIEKHGMGVFAGERNSFAIQWNELSVMNVKSMSEKGLSFFKSYGASNMIQKIKDGI